MNKMYAYLKEHAYVSENKHSNYQFELSEERAKCIANKYNSLTEELQQENKQLKDNWNKLKEYIRKNIIYDDVGMKILDLSPLEDYIQKLEQGSDSNE